ncbi:MAG: DUF3168 domain-containing protein [Chromatiales bacterium]|nr:DUF3168 domain-containing protein [Gammaproteobacteria bacterium]
MVIDQAVYTRLTGHAGIARLVRTRVYPIILPQGEIGDSIVYRRISTSPVSALGADTDLESARYQFTCYARTSMAAQAISEQVRAAWQRYSGIVSTVEIEDVEMETEFDDFSSEPHRYLSIVDFTISYRK